MMTGWGEMTAGAWVWMAVWILALFALVWFLVRGDTTCRAADDADDILRARYARGEIGTAEFEQARRVLHPEHEASRREGVVTRGSGQ